MNKIISLYRDAVRDDWDKQTDATLANMQEAEQNLLSRLSAGEEAVKKVVQLEKEVERLKCCGNCKYFMYCKTDGFIYCEIEVYPFPIKGICGKWQPDGRIFNR